jgi:hypothetical protein
MCPIRIATILQSNPTTACSFITFLCRNRENFYCWNSESSSPCSRTNPLGKILSFDWARTCDLSIHRPTLWMVGVRYGASYGTSPVYVPTSNFHSYSRYDE